jgi:hypothetical protein
MNTTDKLNAIRDLIQEDVGNRGLRTDPKSNLITATAADFAAACRDVAEAKGTCLWVVTGFFIPTAEPPAGETDGPLGALFLARAMPQLGVDVVLFTDHFCVPALRAGLEASGLADRVGLVALPRSDDPEAASSICYVHEVRGNAQRHWNGLWGVARSEVPGPRLFLVALERVGPSHTPASIHPDFREPFLREVPAERHDRCHTMRGRDITVQMSPAHHLFEAAGGGTVRTIGIGDGGNEIGMGKLPWDVIRRNIPNGGLVACRVPTDHLIVTGVSNWGAYALAAGVALLKGQRLDPSLFDVERERELLRVMVEAGPLVDGVTGRPSVSVDGLPFERYAEPLRRLGELTA